MIPMRPSSIFKSRWIALLWAAGMIWFALDIATPSATASGDRSDTAGVTDITGAPVSNQDAQNIADLVGNI